MRAVTFPQTEQVCETTVERFGGVDFATHPTKVDLSHSPDMCNMVASETHFLVKRLGYKTVSLLKGRIHGIFALPGADGTALCHSGTALYLVRENVLPECLVASGLADGDSAAFTMGGKLYLLDGETYRVVARSGETWTIQSVSANAFVPTTTINAPPSGGGVAFEAVNLLSPRRINTFKGDGKATQFKLDAQGLDSSEVTAAVNGTAVTVSSVDRKGGTVTLAAAPPNGNGLANVTITFSKTVAGNADKINRCRIAGLYGGKNDTRVFLAGNPKEPACDWQSGLYDPTYFPDNGYTRIGTDAAAIMGYVKQYESQIVIKEGGAQEASQYLRSYLMADDGSALYPLKQGAQGAGAVSRRCFGNLGDLPLFLSPDGVMAVCGTNVAEQRSIRPVGRAVAPRLAAEPNLENACAVVYQDKYYLAVNRHCYVADGRITAADGSPEWYYWDEIPATCFAVIGDTLFFGTQDGHVCRMRRENDKKAYCDEEEPIKAWWSTPVMSLGAWADGKTLRDFYPVLMSYTRSGAEVSYVSDGSQYEVMSKNLDLFSFLTLDFGRMSFRCRSGASPLRIRRKLHRATTLQMRIGNSRVGEPFGLLALVARWTRGLALK